MKKEKQITFNKPKLERLEKRYNKAIQNNEKQFDFEDTELVTKYAKYLIEHLSEHLK